MFFRPDIDRPAQNVHLDASPYRFLVWGELYATTSIIDYFDHVVFVFCFGGFSGK